MLSAKAGKSDIFGDMHPKPYIQKDTYVFAERNLQWAVRTWFAVFFLGQLIFAAYIFLRYGGSIILGHLERWNKLAPNLYIRGSPMRSALFGFHSVVAGLVTLLGPLQVIPVVRQFAPRFHRVSGRVYIFLGCGMALDGIVLVWRHGAIGGRLDHGIVSINALIILACALSTIRTARKRDIPAHNRWAVHLLLAMSGVWLFRVFLMLWLTVCRGPVGFDPESFTGPFLTTLGLAVYILPQVVVWGYFKARKTQSAIMKLQFSLLLILLSIGMGIGIFAATMRMWLPRIV
jgi:hypothetical protein